MDFLLKKEKIVIETKMTRKATTSKTIGDELIVSRDRYRVHSDCRVLYCFVYDPAEHISSPRGLERDLSKIDDQFEIRVRVVQA